MSKPMSEQMQQVAARYEKATGKKFDQKTNADHIRSMTDEELAEWMEAHNVSCGICSEYVACGGEVVFGDNTCDCDCATHYLNWLRQPYKEATDD